MKMNAAFSIQLTAPVDGYLSVILTIEEYIYILPDAFTLHKRHRTITISSPVITQLT